MSKSRPQSRRRISRAQSAKDSKQEGPGVLKVAKFLDELEAGSVSSIRRGGEFANVMCSGDTGGDESITREEGEKMSVAHEGLDTKHNTITVLVHIRKGEMTVSRDRECTTHEGQRERRKSVLKYELSRVTGIDNGAEDVEGVSKGQLRADVEDNNDAQIVEVADSSEMGRPDRVSHVPFVFSVGTEDDGELGAQRTSHWNA
jgi:hypothetical protein